MNTERTATMLAVQFETIGGPEVLQLVDLPVPRPGPGQVLVRHAAIGVNFIDTYHRTGLYPVRSQGRLGSEASGTVEAVGEGVTRFAPGDRVAYAMTAPGSYAEFHAVSQARTVKLPDEVSFDEAAAALLKGMTAEMLLRRCAPVQSGDTILVQAAAGGVGLILCQWAKAMGVEVIGTVGSEEKAVLARANGCAHTILYDQENVAERVAEITGKKGVRVAYDSVGKTSLEGSLKSLGVRGVLVSFGSASGAPDAVSPLQLLTGGSLFLTRPGLAHYTVTEAEFSDSAAALFDMMISGAVRILIGQRFDLRDAAEAHRALEGRRTIGSSLLVVLPEPSAVAGCKLSA